MKHLTTVLLALLPASALADDPTIDQAAEVGAPVTVGNLTIFPLTPKTPATDDTDVVTLDEAFDQKLLSIKETDESGSVNTLHVSNKGKTAVYAMVGEVLLGGKQDRIVGRNVLIPPGAREMEVAVFCVEHGRWTQETAQFGSAKTLAHTTLRQQANKGSQGAVWAEVAKTNEKLQSKTATDTYRAAVKKVAAAGDVEKAVKELERQTAAVGGMAGIIVAVNGELRALDWFASPKLYRKLEHKLVSSYVSDALGEADGQVHPAPQSAAAKQFVANASKVRVKSEEASGAGRVYDFDSKDIEGQMLKPAAGKRAIHETYYIK